MVLQCTLIIYCIYGVLSFIDLMVVLMCSFLHLFFGGLAVRGGVTGRPEFSPPYWYFAFFSDGFRILKEKKNISCKKPTSHQNTYIKHQEYLKLPKWINEQRHEAIFTSFLLHFPHSRDCKQFTWFSSVPFHPNKNSVRQVEVCYWPKLPQQTGELRLGFPNPSWTLAISYSSSHTFQTNCHPLHTLLTSSHRKGLCRNPLCSLKRIWP